MESNNLRHAENNQLQDGNKTELKCRHRDVDYFIRTVNPTVCYSLHNIIYFTRFPCSSP